MHPELVRSVQQDLPSSAAGVTACTPGLPINSASQCKLKMHWQTSYVLFGLLMVQCLQPQHISHLVIANPCHYHASAMHSRGVSRSVPMYLKWCTKDCYQLTCYVSTSCSESDWFGAIKCKIVSVVCCWPHCQAQAVQDIRCNKFMSIVSDTLYMVPCQEYIARHKACWAMMRYKAFATMLSSKAWSRIWGVTCYHAEVMALLWFTSVTVLSVKIGCSLQLANSV